MKIAIMQPYFFPYLGYFSLIDAVDYWIIFDTPQYIRKGWINRNRILKKGGGWKYFGLYIQKASRQTPIHKIECKADDDWRNRIIRGLDLYKQKKAPFFDSIIQFLEHTYDIECLYLADLLVHCLKKTCELIELPFRYSVLSQIDLKIGPIKNSGDWALHISKAVSATEYINPLSGRRLFDPDAFKSAGIKLRFLKTKLPEYDQRSTSFLPDLSIIDSLMWNHPGRVKALLRNYEVIK